MRNDVLFGQTILRRIQSIDALKPNIFTMAGTSLDHGKEGESNGNIRSSVSYPDFFCVKLGRNKRPFHDIKTKNQEALFVSSDDFPRPNYRLFYRRRGRVFY